MLKYLSFYFSFHIFYVASVNIFASFVSVVVVVNAVVAVFVSFVVVNAVVAVFVSFVVVNVVVAVFVSVVVVNVDVAFVVGWFFWFLFYVVFATAIGAFNAFLNAHFQRLSFLFKNLFFSLALFVLVVQPTSLSHSLLLFSPFFLPFFFLFSSFFLPFFFLFSFFFLPFSSISIPLHLFPFLSSISYK